MKHLIDLQQDDTETVIQKLTNEIYTRDENGGDVWAGRAVTLIHSITPLVMQNKDEMKKLSDLRDGYGLGRVIEHINTNGAHAQQAKEFLKQLPDAQKGVVTQKFIEHYGYLVMQVQRVLNAMITYKQEDLGYSKAKPQERDLLGAQLNLE